MKGARSCFQARDPKSHPCQRASLRLSLAEQGGLKDEYPTSLTKTRHEWRDFLMTGSFSTMNGGMLRSQVARVIINEGEHVRDPSNLILIAGAATSRSHTSQ